MSKIQLKITCSNTLQENHNVNEERQSKDTTAEMNQMLAFLTRHRRSNHKIILQVIMSYVETNEQIDNSRKEVEIIKRKNQVEITEVKSKTTKIISLDRFATRVKIIEDIISEPKDRATGFTSSKIKKRNIIL